MSTRVSSIAIVVSFVLTASPLYGQTPPRQAGVPVMIQFNEHEPAGGQDQVDGPEAEHRIERLLAEAEQMQARADKLRAEAMELKQAISKRRQRADEAMHADEMHRKLAALREVAGHLEREGMHEQARDMNEKADVLAEELRQRGEPIEGAQAGDLWTRMEEIKVMLQPEGDGPERSEKLERRLAELNEAAERAAHAGREGQARELRMEAERVAQELEEHHKHVRRAELHEAEQHLENLEREMQGARERGEQERLGNLEREADEVRQMLRRERESREMAEHMENMHRELEELSQAAERAERERHPDLAHELRRKAMEVAERIESHDREMHERHMQEAEARLEQLGRQARQAREQGRHDEAEHMMAEAEDIERNLHAERERRRMHELMGRLHELMEEMTGSYHRALEEGQFDRAEGFRTLVESMADMVAGHLGEHHAEHDEVVEHYAEWMSNLGTREISVVIRPEDEIGGQETDSDVLHIHMEEPEGLNPGVWDVDERIGQLRERARDAKEAGDREQADAISEEADALERHLRSMNEPKDDKPPVAPRILEDEVRLLRQEVGSLQRQMEGLMDALRRKIGDF